MYIGKTPALGNYQKCDAITTSATATYNLTVGSVAVSPETANNCIVSLNGVIQAPTDAYTISGSTIVFNSALTSADVIDFILILGDVLDIGTPSDDTVTLAKLASGTDGEIISWDASGNPVAIGAGTSGHFLKSQGAGSQPVFAAAGGGKINQVVTTVIDGVPSSTSTSFADISGGSVTITPSAASSKVLVQASINGTIDRYHIAIKIVDGSGSDISGFVGTARSSRVPSTFDSWYSHPDNTLMQGSSCTLLDSPSSTSAETYKLQWKVNGGTAYMNRGHVDADAASTGCPISQITAWEILA